MYTPKNSNPPANLKSFPYLEYLPQGYGSGKKFPLVIFLHGAGERGEPDSIDLVARHGWMRQVRAGAEFPFVMLAPQCPPNQYWGCFTESLNAFLDEALALYDVDPRRVYLTGLSMGGTGTWMWSMANPERFAAVIPVCGTGICWLGSRLAKKPIWIFHGEADSIVPVEESMDMVRSLRKSGGEPRLTIYPGVEHNSWVNAYAEAELIPWMLSQKIGE